MSCRFHFYPEAYLEIVRSEIPASDRLAQRASSNVVAHYHIVPERSRVSIWARSSLHPIETSTDGLQGALDLEILAGGRLNLQSQPQAKVSLPVDQLKSGNPLEDRELRRRIDARRFPTIGGELLEMQQTGVEGRYLVRGNVTFRGISRSYAREMSFTAVDDRTLRIEGESTFDVRDFGMEPPKILMLKVEPEVRVRVEIVAEKEV